MNSNLISKCDISACFYDYDIIPHQQKKKDPFLQTCYLVAWRQRSHHHFGRSIGSLIPRWSFSIYITSPYYLGASDVPWSWLTTQSKKKKTKESILWIVWYFYCRLPQESIFKVERFTHELKGIITDVLSYKTRGTSHISLSSIVTSFCWKRTISMIALWLEVPVPWVARSNFELLWLA
jgi:hypothetical protein